MNSSTNSEALTAAGGTPPSGPRIAQSSRDLRIQLPAISSRPANSRGFGPEPFFQNYGLARAQAGVDITRPSEGQYLGGPPSISPEFRERVAMAACFAFFGSIAVILGVAAFFVSMLIDWYGVAETGFRLFDFG